MEVFSQYLLACHKLMENVLLFTFVHNVNIVLVTMAEGSKGCVLFECITICGFCLSMSSNWSKQNNIFSIVKL